MAFKAKVKTQSSGGNNSGSETVAVRLKSLHLVDANYSKERREPKPNDDDYMVAYLMHDALGIQVAYDDNGASVTEVKVKLRPSNYTGENKPYGISDFRKGAKKGNSPKMGDNPIVLLENAWVDRKTGDISCGWLHCAAHDSVENPNASLEGKTEHVIVDAWTVVRNEEMRKDPTTGVDRPVQNRQVYWPQAAQVISNVEDLKSDENASWLIPNPDFGGGRPFVTLRLYEIASATPIAVGTIYGGARNEEGELKHPSEVIDEFLARQVANDESADKDENFDFYLRNLEGEVDADGNPAYVLEMIPGWTFGTGSKSLPSQQKRRPDHENFKSFVLDAEGNQVTDNDGNPIMSAMITKAHVVIKRGEFEDGLGAWFATSTQVVKRNFTATYHSIYDLPTEVTPPNLRDVFVAKAEKRMELARATRNNNNTQDQAPEEGVPDQSAGMTNGFTPS